MPLLNLHHIALPCLPDNLEKTRRFYVDVLGTKPGHHAKLGLPGSRSDINNVMFDLVAPRALEQTDPWRTRKAADPMADHIVIKAFGFDEMRERLIAHEADWRQLDLRSAGVWQLFVIDPNGIVVEMNFDIGREPPGSQGPDGTHPYLIADMHDGVVQRKHMW